MELTEVLVELETAGWQALVDGGGRAWFRGVIDDPLVAVGAGFGVVTGEAALDRLADDTWSWFRIRAPQVWSISPDVALLTYRVIARRDFDTEHQAVVSSTYRRVDDQWRLAVRHHTTI